MSKRFVIRKKWKLIITVDGSFELSKSFWWVPSRKSEPEPFIWNRFRILTKVHLLARNCTTLETNQNSDSSFYYFALKLYLSSWLCLITNSALGERDWVRWCAGCLAVSREGWGSRSTASVTSTWFWSPTSRAQGISWGRAWKGQRLGGWAWAATGVRTGSQTLFWLVSHSPSGSQPVTDAPPPPGTSYPPIGNLVKHSPPKISESNNYCVWWFFC